MIFAAIADWAENNEYPVDFMCTELEVSRSGYYAWRSRPVSHRDLTDIDLTARIRRIHNAGHGNPGGEDVVSLTGRRTAAQLPGDARPLPTVDKYDELLRGAGSS